VALNDLFSSTPSVTTLDDPLFVQYQQQFGGDALRVARFFVAIGAMCPSKLISKVEVL